MRIQYMFWLDEYVGRETCDVSSNVDVRSSANSDLLDRLDHYDVWGWDYSKIIGEPKRIPVAGWDDGKSVRSLRVNQSVQAVAYWAGRGLYAWAVVASSECETTLANGGDIKSLESAQLAAEDAIREMGRALLGSIGEGV